MNLYFISCGKSEDNSEELIKAMPKAWVNSYSNYSRDNISEEMNVLAEVVEVFLDEKAIAKIANGNLMFVFKDMKKKEVTYKSYDYDENYKYVEVEKTKTELLPDFLMMISTENKDLLEKIVKLGYNADVIGFLNEKTVIYKTHKKTRLLARFLIAYRANLFFTKIVIHFSRRGL